MSKGIASLIPSDKMEDELQMEREARAKVSLLNDSVNIRLKKYFTNSKSPSSYVITH